MKKNLDIKWIGVVFVLLAVVFVQFSGIYDFTTLFHLLPQSVTGISSMGCQQGEFISEDPFYSNSTLYCKQTLGTLEGQFTLSEGNAFELFGIYTSEPITETSVKLKDQCRLPFDATNTEFIYEYKTQSGIQASGGSWRCVQGTPPRGYTYLGKTDFYCSTSPCVIQWYPDVSGCINVFRKTTGQVYYLDPVAIYDYEQQINMTLGDKTYSVIVSDKNRTGHNDLFRVILSEGSLQGTQSCPAYPNTIAYISNEFTSVPIDYLSRSYADSIVNSQRTATINSLASGGAESHNNLVASFLSSSPSLGQYCEIATPTTTSILTAYIACNPVGSVTIPTWDLFINAEKVGYRVPSGNPIILSTSVTKVESAVRSEVSVTVRNDGDSDNIEATIQCSQDLSPFSSSEYINEGETKTILINYQGAGIIDNCEVTAFSKNSPQNADITTQKIFIYPFCPREAPSIYHETVFTEFGCAFICPNYHTGSEGADVLSANCRAIEEYERCYFEILSDGTVKCESRKSYTGIHCVDSDGHYMKTNAYFDAVNRGSISPYIPEQRENYYYVVSVNGEPVCSYVNAYGYSGGVELSSLEFDYSAGFPEGSEQFVDTIAPTEPPLAEPPEEIPEIPAPEEETPIIDQISFTIDEVWNELSLEGKVLGGIALIGVMAGIVFGFLNWRKKK